MPSRDGKDVFIAGVMEHIEEAGIHSGDSACSLPPYSLKAPVIAEMERQAKVMALALNVVGLMNVQFAIKDDEVYVLEVNPRASRTVPFVAKVIGIPVAKIAARVMAGESLASFKLKQKKLAHVAVKEAVFPFNRFPGVDVLLGPEMRSTGEVMGLDMTYDMAFAKSQLGAGMRMPQAGTVFISVKDADKAEDPARHEEARRHGLQARRHRRHPALFRGQGRSLHQDQQGAGRPPACGGRHQERRHPAGAQHHRNARLAVRTRSPSARRR